MNKACWPKKIHRPNVGWAKQQAATCPTKQSKRNIALQKKLSNTWEIKNKTKQSSRLNVGHVVPPLPNLLIISNSSLGKVITCPTKQRPNKQQGITYIEIMIVVVILAIVAVVAMPNSSPTDARKLDIAAEEIAQAIRFARIEAMRTGISSGVFINSSSDYVKVYKLLSEVATYDVYHPVDKKLYKLSLNTDIATAGVKVQSYGFYFGGSGSNREYLSFNTNGNPIYTNSGNDSLLDSATITLSYAGQTRVISVAPMTGRVTIQ